MDIIEQKLRLQGLLQLAYFIRSVDDSQAIIFVHGFGSSKEHFRHAFKAPTLSEFTLVALDLVGFGGSTKAEDFSYSMDEQARVMLQALCHLGIESFNLCAHSMGGLVGMRMVKIAPERIKSFINMEGNLTPEDCFISGKIIEVSYEEFLRSGRRRFEERLENDALTDPSLSSYLETFKKASSTALYRSAQHTFEDSLDPQLLESFSKLKKCCYIYGEKSRNIYPAEKRLHELGVPVFYVEDAGHSMAEENPQQLYTMIGMFIHE